MADLGVFSRYKSFGDIQSEANKEGLAAALTQAQIQKLATPDIEDLGKQAFLKASQGVTLSPQENAALQYLDSKSQTVGFNPVTGALEQKPGLLDRAGIALPSTQPAASTIKQTAAQPKLGANFTNAMNAPSTGGGDFLAEVAPASEPNQWDAEFQAQLSAVGNNPKARQALIETYAKKKIDMNDQESKDATFADRMRQSNPLIDKYAAAGMDNTNLRLDKNLPDFIANRVVSDDYQSFNQAQRDFINAQLRKESGAAIAPSEFQNAAKQYFPQVGDSDQVLAQKKANRDAAVAGMVRAAGPAYKPAPMPTTPGLADKEKAARAVASPAELSAFKKKYGIK